MCSEELRQNVFSSIHMSTLAKSVQAGITYPSCTYCGGMLVSGSSKSSPKRKSALCQLTLYTNSSESFIVWYKKLEEPKGMLWMRSCCVRKGLEENTVELISRSCRGRCSYTLKFSANRANDDWYRLLKQESRKIPSVGDELPSSLDEGYLASLDSMLTDISPLSVLNEVLHGSSDSDNQGENTKESQDQVAPPPTTKTPKFKSIKGKKSTVICNPLQGLSCKSRKTSVITISSSFSNNSTVGSVQPLDNPETVQTDADNLSRWSWPMKAYVAT